MNNSGNENLFDKYLEYLYVTGQLDNFNNGTVEEDEPNNDDTIAVKLKQRGNDEWYRKVTEDDWWVI